MLRNAIRVSVPVVLCCFASSGLRDAFAELTPEHTEQLTELRREVSLAPRLIRQKEYTEAESLLAEAERELYSIAEDAGIELSNRALQGVVNLIARHRETLERTRPREFARDVAPIVADNCLRCHGGNNPRAGLRLDTFANWKRGGDSGALLVPGSAGRSLLMARLTAADPRQRMPQNAEPLERNELAAIAAWINEGARFDGDESAALADLAAAAMRENDPSVVIPRPDGDETVSFTEDIAPFMANLCVGCHSGDDPRGGLSLVSFYDMMRGGDSGEVIVPGSLEESLLWQLAGLQDPIKMPAGQARITRQNWNDLRQWFLEGNTFDGDDPRTPLREYVRSETEMEADRFARMSAEEFHTFRRERSEEQYRRAVRDEAARVDGEDFFLIGNVSEERLREIQQWAQDYQQTLQTAFDTGDGPLWKGGLTIFVLRDDFSYNEFNLVINQREAPEELIGHSVVSPTYEDAYIALLDVGDAASAESPGMQVNLMDHLTGAFLKRDGAQLPDWVIRGTGLALAAKVAPANPYLRNLGLEAKRSLAELRNPEDVFADGTFSPASTGAVGYTLVDYLLDVGGSARFGRFIGALRSGRDVETAVRQIYGRDPGAVARGYLGSL